MITKKRIPCCDGQYAIEVPWPIPSKKNSYEIFFAPAIRKAIRPIVEKIKNTHGIKRPYWISPSQRVKQFEKNLSTWFALYLPDFGTLPLSIEIQVNQKNDVDNIAGAVLDALEKSRRIGNDRQVEAITILRSNDIEDSIVVITPLKTKLAA